MASDKLVVTKLPLAMPSALLILFKPAGRPPVGAGHAAPERSSRSRIISLDF